MTTTCVKNNTPAASAKSAFLVPAMRRAPIIAAAAVTPFIAEKAAMPDKNVIVRIIQVVCLLIKKRQRGLEFVDGIGQFL